MTVRVYLLLGGLKGTAIDDVTQEGMFALRDRLVAAGFEVNTNNWGNWQNLPLHAVDNARVAVIGYSGGGSRATMLANAHPYLTIDLMILYDPSPEWQMEAIQGNVKMAIVYQNSMKDLAPLGGGILTLGHGNKTTLVKVVPISEPHMKVQDDKDLHDITVAALTELAK